MTELENQEVDNIEIDEVETIDNEETELTVEDYKKERARREKAERTLVELKKQLKEKEKAPETGLTEEKLALREELTEFLAENKDLKEYKSELLKYREQWFTMKQAVALVENDDKTIENRKKANLNISSWEEWAKKTTFTQEEIAKLPLEERAKKYEMFKAWKIKIK